MKILSIGNGFSRDAHYYLPRLAMENGVPMELYNLFIGGCDLRRHWDNAIQNRQDYLLEKDGVSTGCYVSLVEALEMEPWDVITLQQAGRDSGRPQTYVPYLDRLGDLVRSCRLEAKLYFHQTWAYEETSDHPGFAHYQNSGEEMFRRISDAAEMASKLLDAPLIPVGKVIRALRVSVPAFDAAKGGISLYRDGLHLSMEYGRFAAAATWFFTLTGTLPKAQSLEQLDPVLVDAILSRISSLR